MKFWKYIELDDGIGHGLTEEGRLFWEMEIQGWNDNETFSDLTDLVTIQAIVSHSDPEIEVKVHFSHPALKEDLMIDKLVHEAMSDLRAAASSFREQD